ncbi:MAG TPA: hypothetical protein VFI53_15540 [Myxococcaceae bacterium]|nr:hypothetical protein [Myxococcaceae bacterium]
MDAETLRLVERAIARHGGERWSRIEAIELPVLALSGFLPWLKGYPRSFGLPRIVRIDPVRVRAAFVDYPRPGEQGVFDRGRVALGPAEPVEHRASFSGAGRRRQWSALDALYFFGYALTHYHSLPWRLRDAEVLAVGPTRQSGATHALTVRFPRTVHTHSAVQTIYFAEDGLIVRHDYVAEVISPFAQGAHLWLDYVEVKGIPIATHRRVLTRIGRQTLPLVALDARLGTPVIESGR